MEHLIKDIEKSLDNLDNLEIVINDLEDLEDIVTPALGSGCSCNGIM